MKPNTHIWSYLTHFFLEWEIFQTKFVAKIKTHILCSVTFFSFENTAVYEIMWKNIVEWGRPHTKNGARALNAGYLRLQIHTLRLCKTHCFSKTTMVARTRLSVALYVHCLSGIFCLLALSSCEWSWGDSSADWYRCIVQRFLWRQKSTSQHFNWWCR
jgi:hypothetical protein